MTFTRLPSRCAAALVSVLLIAGAVPAMAQTAPVTDPKVTAAQANVRLGLEYLRKGEVALARDKIERALAQNPKDVGVQLGAGLLYERLGEGDKAEKHYRQALKVDPKSPEAQNALGAFLCRRGKNEQGEELFVKAASNPLSRSPEVSYVNAGVCARADARLDAADKHFRQALAIRPNSRDALAQLASLSLERKAYLPARAFVQRYLAAGPAVPEVLLLGVRVETELGDTAAAADYRRRLLADFPSSAEAAQVAPTAEAAR